MNATELVSIQGPQARAAGPTALSPDGPFSVADTRPGPGRGHSGATVHAVAGWLGRALAASARGWALAAGVNPDLLD